ncbi:MAG: hypothetical protein K8S56_04755 [Candidatus Cloacimonetes bacterium]|nr:hypothetical protein [Candidatus Cloacimonadota bacterium]
MITGYAQASPQTILLPPKELPEETTPVAVMKLSGIPEASITVTRLLLAMQQDECGQLLLKSFVAPSEIAAIANPDSVHISRYQPQEFFITEVHGDTVQVVISGADKKNKWKHQLTFLCVRENNAVYVKPSPVVGMYIDPWIKADTFIE